MGGDRPGRAAWPLSRVAVSIGPGATQFTRTPCRATVLARAKVKPTSAALEVA